MNGNKNVSSKHYNIAAFILGLIGGILILINGLLLAIAGMLMGVFFPIIGLTLATRTNFWLISPNWCLYDVEA